VASLRGADTVIKQQLASVGRAAGAAGATAAAGAKAITALEGRATSLEGAAAAAAKDLIGHAGRITANAGDIKQTNDDVQSVENRVTGLEFRSKDLGSLFNLAAATDARSKQNSASLSGLSGSIAAVQKSVNEYESVKVFATRAEQRSRENVDDIGDLDVRLKKQEDVAADLSKRLSTQVDQRISAVETTAGAARAGVATNAKAIADQGVSLGNAVQAAQNSANSAGAAAKAASDAATAGLKVVGDRVTAEESRALKVEGGLRQSLLDFKSAVSAANGGHNDALDDLHAITKGQAATIEKEVNDEEQRAIKAEQALGDRISANTQTLSKVSGTVAALGQQATGQDTAITGLKSAVAGKASTDSVNKVAASAATLASSSTQQAKDISNNAANIANNVASISTTNNRQTAESKRAKAAEAANKASIGGLSTDRDSLKTRVGTLEAALQEASSSTELDNVKKDVASIAADVKTRATNTKVNGIAATVSTVSTSVKAVGVRVDGVNSAVTSLKKDVAAKASQSSVNSVDAAVKSVTATAADLGTQVKAAAASAASRATQTAFNALSNKVTGNSNGIAGLSNSLKSLTNTVAAKASTSSVSSTNTNLANEVARAKRAESTNAKVGTSAQSTANAAKSTANAAKSTANAAKSTANAAKSKGDSLMKSVKAMCIGLGFKWQNNECLPAPGSTDNNPATSCREVKDSGQKTGPYFVKHSGSGVARKVYCDNSYDGGGWELIHKVGHCALESVPSRRLIPRTLPLVELPVLTTDPRVPHLTSLCALGPSACAVPD